MYKLKTKEELNNYMQSQWDVFEELINSEEPCVWLITHFLELHSSENSGKYGLGDRLRETSICGIPSNILFSMYDICEGLCDEISRTFVVAVNDRSARVCAAIDYEIADGNYEQYCNCPTDAHHTWAEIEIDGVNYAFDFTRQYVMKAEAYYKFRDITEDQIYKINDYKAILQTYTDFSLMEVMAKLYSKFCNDTKYLLDAYDSLIENLSKDCEDNIINRETKKYCANELIRMKHRLEASGISSDYKFSARQLYLKWEDSAEGTKDKTIVIKDENRQEDIEIMRSIFTRSEEVGNLRNNTYVGPKESAKIMLKEIQEIIEK